ncbi:MAG: hypothetical protein V3T72_18450 [Thermoanaerobaculia bacterium]
MTPSDFEADTSAVPGALMPVPTDPVDTEGTFTFDVLNALLDALNSDDLLAIFSIQGRVDLQSTGQGLQVKNDPLPTLQFATPPPIPPSPLVFAVLSAPSLGTLLTPGQTTLTRTPEDAASSCCRERLRLQPAEI